MKIVVCYITFIMKEISNKEILAEVKGNSKAIGKLDAITEKLEQDVSSLSERMKKLDNITTSIQ